MAKKLNRTVAGVEVPGLRKHLRDRYQREVTEGDPRLTFLDVSSAQRRKFNARSPVVREAQAMLDRLDAGEPVTIPAWMLGGNSFPSARAIPFIAERTCAAVTVAAGDMVRPA
jgi:hypothetical protein